MRPLPTPEEIRGAQTLVELTTHLRRLHGESAAWRLDPDALNDILVALMMAVKRIHAARIERERLALATEYQRGVSDCAIRVADALSGFARPEEP